jgi:hypothetical protein
LDEEMHNDKKNVLLIAMPFAGTDIPSIQLAVLEGYLNRGIFERTKHKHKDKTSLFESC